MNQKTVLLAFLMLAVFAKPAHAQSFAVEPKNFFLRSSPGEKIIQSIMVKNLSGEHLKISFKFENKTSLQRKIDFAQISPNSTKIEPFSTANFELILNIPAKISPGDYFTTLSASSGTDTENIDLTLRVLGVSEEKIAANISKNESLTISFKNEGDLTSKISGKFELSWFWIANKPKLFERTIKAASEEKILFPKPTLPGYYQIKLTFSYGEKEDVLILSFWEKPKILLISSLLIFLLIFYLGRRIWLKGL